MNNFDEKPIPGPDLVVCSWCGSQYADHRGGFTLPDGQTVTGDFCDETHFNLWVNWKSSLLSFLLKQKEAVPDE